MIQLISAKSAQAPVAEGQVVQPAREGLPASIAGATSEGDFIAQLTRSLLQSDDGLLEEQLQAALADAEQPFGLTEQELAEGAEPVGQAADAASGQAAPAEQAVPVLGQAVAPAEVAGSAGADADAEALPAERWLRGMQSQHQAVVTARDSSSLLSQRATAAQPATLETPLHTGIEQPAVDEAAQQAASLLAGQSRDGGPSLTAAAALGAGLESTSSVDTAAAAQRGQATLQLQNPEAKWGEQMLQALRNHVQLQLQQQSQHATIRLDPPELGSLDLLLSHESGRLTVQITAVNADVARLLQQTSERLRQELVGQNFLQVDVQVFSDGQQGRHEHARQHQPRFTDELPTAAATVAGTATERQGAGRDSDLLVTV